jgi:hypothetical protein
MKRDHPEGETFKSSACYKSVKPFETRFVVFHELACSRSTTCALQVLQFMFPGGFESHSLSPAGILLLCHPQHDDMNSRWRVE